jgi:hypothetical protein
VLGKERNGEKFIADAPSLQRETIRGQESFLALVVFQRIEFTATQERIAIFEAEKIPQESCYDFAFCFLPRLPLFPAQCCDAFSLPLSCSCLLMSSAFRYLWTGAIGPSGWGWPCIFV